MEEAEHSQYVTQLKVEFDSCDTTATGFLDRDELMALCRKLQLDAHLPLLLNTLLGERTYARVNFEEFKDGLVDVLSRSLDLSTSEEDSSYQEPVVPEEVKPKFVKGTKRYGRRSRPDSKMDAAPTCDSEDSPPSRTQASGSSPAGVRRAKVRRSTSLESMESLKSDEDTGSQKDVQQDFQCKGPQQEEVQPGGGDGGGVPTAVCDHLGLQQLSTQDVDALLSKLDANLDGRVSIRDFQSVLCGPAPICCSTPLRSADLQRAPRRAPVLLEERSACSASPPSLTAAAGLRLLSRLDEGSGLASPERVVSLWTEEGVRNGRDILQTLDFPLEERLSLTDLTLALDNELLTSSNAVHQAALVCYRTEIQHLQAVLEQVCRERDKAKADLDQSDLRNLQLIREVDDHHATMETLNQTRIRDLEQDFRDRLTALRSQSEQESDALLQQVERERRALRDELQLLRAQEAELQEELCSTTQDNSRLEEDLRAVKLKLTEAESSVSRLQTDLNQLLNHKFGGLDAAGGGLTHEERFSEIVKEYELQCRELRDRNDELSSELELLRTQRSDRKSRRADGDDIAAALSWTQQRAAGTESDSDESDMKRSSSPLIRKKLQPADKTALCVLDSVSGPSVSIQTEMALEQLKQKHEQELQQLHIQLDTQVNYYERSLEVMRQSMEVERKDISQAFKLEISELEEQKEQMEQEVNQLKEKVDKLQTELQHAGGAGWSSEQERRMQRERAELEQNFAREIGNLVQRLSAEKEQQEAQLRLQMDQEASLLRQEAEQQCAHMKLQHADAQRHLLHQLHQHKAFWEHQLNQSEQEKASISSQKKEVEDQQEELKEQLRRLQEAPHSSQLHGSQSEARGRCSELEAELRGARGRCSELEAELTEARGRCSELEAELRGARGRCAELEESSSLLESQEELTKHLASERSCVEEEVQQLRIREEQLLLQEARLKEELENLQEADTCIHLFDNSIQQEAQLWAELEVLQEATRSRAAEMDSLRRDRSRLIQDLKEQAMAVDHLQLELDAVSEEARRRSSAQQALQEALQQEKEEASRLSQENGSYTRLADQLSTQIVEMEEEISSLREHLRDLSSQLSASTDLVLHLRTQLHAATGPGDGEEQRRRAEEDFEQEKRRLQQQLEELEELVLALEEATDPTSPHRAQLEEVRSENAALQERLSVLQQEVIRLEDDVDKKRRREEELEQEHLRSREEEEKLHRENCRYREEVLELSSRNLQLSNDNAELSAHLRGDQEAVRMLRERLATISKEQEEEGAAVRRLQDVALQQERDKLQQQAAWTQERQLLEAELNSCKEKLSRQSQLEAELSAVTLKLSWLEDDKDKLLRDAEDRNNKVEKLHQALLSVEAESELLRSQLLAVSQEKLSHSQEVTELQRKLQDAHNKVEELECSVRRLRREQEGLRRSLEEQASASLQEEIHKLSVHNQELQQQVTRLQVRSLEVHKLNQEQQNLKTKVRELETERTQAQDQAQRADAALGVAQARHVRRLAELQQQAGDGCREQLLLLQRLLQEEQGRNQQLEEELRLQAQQSSSHISSRQEQYEKALAALQQRSEEQDSELKGVRLVLQEKVQQLKEQMARSTKASALLKELYVENAQLMKALQVTERRQKHAEKKNFLLEERVGALNMLLRDIVPAALAT